MFFTAFTLAIYHFRINGFVKGNVHANLIDEILWKRLVAAPDGVREFIDRSIMVIKVK